MENVVRPSTEPKADVTHVVYYGIIAFKGLFIFISIGLCRILNVHAAQRTEKVKTRMEFSGD